MILLTILIGFIFTVGFAVLSIILALFSGFIGMESPIWPLCWPAILFGGPGLVVVSTTNWFALPDITTEGDILKQLFEIFKISFIFWWVLLSIIVHYLENIKALTKSLSHSLRSLGPR
jgi:hypothetical protein